MTRRRMLQGALAAGIGYCAAGCGLGPRSGGALVAGNASSETFSGGKDQRRPVDGGRPPNIVVILTDDMGFGDLTCQGATAIRTPHIDALAAGGVRMTNFYASAPICSPSRAGLLTGRYPVRTGITDALLTSDSFMGIGQRLLGYTECGIPPDELLLPELLRDRGFRTALVGKWHLGDKSPHLPNDNGFDEFYGPLRSNDLRPFEIFRNRDLVEPHPADQATLTRRYTREAVRFIEENRSRPFFLYLAHTFPHIPLHASDAFRGKSTAGLYGDTVEEIDWSTGNVLAALKKHGLSENTLVIFTSDNGPWYQGSPGRFRGRKRHVFEGGFRVPLIARWPGTIPRGAVCKAAGMNFDIFRTALAAAGLDAPGDRVIDGRNMLPAWQGRAEALHDELFFYWRKELWAMRRGAWKYHRHHEVGDINPYPWPSNTRKGPYLFNLETDPEESYSLLENRPEIGRELSGAMARFEAALKRNPRGWLR